MYKIVVPYKDRDKSSIIVTHLEEPYGPGSSPVISVGCTLKDDVDNPTWKVHLPIDILQEVIDAMKEVASPEWRQRAE